MNSFVQPVVSILMAINKVDIYTESSIKSIQAQSLQNFEFIIVANAMSEQDRIILESLVQSDSRIKIIATEIPGLANALNLGLSIASCKYVARMDADDISLPERLDRQYHFLISHPDYVLVGCKSLLIDEAGNSIAQFPFLETNKSIRRALPFRNRILHPAIMFLKSEIIKVGGYKYGHMSEDHELFIRLSRNPSIKFYNLDQILFYYRRHSNQITSLRNAHKHYAEIFGFLFTEFLLTKNPSYLIGGLLVHPLLRSIKPSLNAAFCLPRKIRNFFS